MPSFDIVNKIDMQEVDNAVNITARMTQTRYDFRGSKTTIELNRKENHIHAVTEDTMKMKAIEGELINNLVKRKVDPKALDYRNVEQAAGDMIKRDIYIREGIDTDTARKIVKLVKDLKLKVQAQIQPGQVRVSGKKLDDLQAVIAMLKQQDLGIPLQFINMRK